MIVKNLSTAQLLSKVVREGVLPTARSSARAFTSTSSLLDGQLAEKCDLHMVSSPYPPIPIKDYEPVSDLVLNAWKASSKKRGDQVAIIDGSTGMQRTYNNFYNSTRGLAGSLKYDLGVREQDCVCIFAPNHVDYLPATLAVGLCGAKITPVNPLYKKEELLQILDRSRSTVLISHISGLDIALEAARQSKHVKHVVVMTANGKASPVEGVETLDSIMKHNKAFDKTIRDMHPHTDHHPFLLPYSSGTTGLPKGVCLTHSNIVANLLQFEEAEGMVFGVGEKMISPLPFFHIYGMTCSNIYCGWKGHPVITLSGRFDLPLFLDLIQEHRPTRAHLVPPIMLHLAKQPMVDDYDLSSLKCIISAAAPLGRETEVATKNRLGCQVKQAWGMSELSPIGTFTSDFNVKPSSIGQLVSSTYGKILGEDGKSLGPNEPGELCIKGPQVMMGYLDDPDKTAECLSKSGWLRTGDVAYYDEEGFFYITDRMKELIKVRGFQVAPAELEAMLLDHDLINDAAVIPLPSEEHGELPRAYIVLKDPDAATAETESEIYEWIKAKVAPYKRLDGGIVFTDSIPKSASGKILRRELRESLKEETAAA
mmetsp:Transcript_55972/g.162173  ORF Transcript_55972/g.162173 Transcript_55972/m.162173 type:complete len:595 (-) Transcript_55972:181-1965(-)